MVKVVDFKPLAPPVIFLLIKQTPKKGLFPIEIFFEIMQFSQKSELKPAFLLPKSAILAIIFPKIKRLRPLPNKVRKITVMSPLNLDFLLENE
jgi:hypothetical protein